MCNVEPKSFTLDEEIKRTRIRLRHAKSNPQGCRDFGFCGICQGTVTAERDTLLRLLTVKAGAPDADD